MRSTDLSAEEVRRVLSYDPFTGEFRWRVRTANCTAVGRKAGGVDPQGYVKIKVHKVAYFAHRLAWLYAHGKWPEHEIDHVNRDRADNRLHNLRDVTKRVNHQNIREPRSNNTHGFLGVRYTPRMSKHKPWNAAIKIEGVERNLGRYSTGEEAHAAYLEAKRKFHEGNTL